MKSFLFCFVIVVFSLFFAPSIPAQNGAPFPAGEKLTYNVSFANFTEAGFVELNTIGREKLGEREVTRLQAKVRTTGIVNATLLALDNEYNSLVSDAGVPLRVERMLRESYAPTEVRRDFVENFASVANNGVHDLVSVVYYVRTLPLTNGSVYPLKIWDSERIYDAELRVTGREIMSTAVGAFNTFVVQVRVSNNDAFSRYRFKINISEDERRLPIRFAIKHPKGEIRADLASVQTILPEVAIPQPTPVVTPNPVNRPPTTPRPTPVPKPYVENQPLAADLPFVLGERLRFDVSSKNRKVASVLFQIGERKQFFGRDAVQLTATVVQSTSDLLPNGSLMNSYIHPDFLVPLRSEMRGAGRFVKFNQTMTFDQERGAVVTDKGVSAELPVGTFDILSLAYAMRAFRLEAGKNTVIKDTKAAIIINKTPIIVTFRQTGRERILFNGTQIPAIALNLTTGNPQFDSMGLRLWLSEDARRLPLRFVVNTPLGAVQADLVADR